MQASDLRPAGNFAAQYGVKSIVYGAPGTGKTPIANSAPRPVLLITEPGMLSMRGSTIPSYPAFTTKAIDDFFEWVMKSNEARNFDTVCIDSLSQLAETILLEELSKKSNAGNKVNGQAAYGEMSRRTMAHLRNLYFLQNKHTYLICKQASVEENNTRYYRPYFPGQELNVQMPHLYDVIMHLAVHNIPGYGLQKAFRCRAGFDSIARDRSGKLEEFEQCNLTALFNKAMS